jgi:ribose transport system permease protein
MNGIGTTEAPLPARRTLHRPRLSLGRYTGVLVGLIAVSLFLSIDAADFLTWQNWENIIRSESVVLALALGTTFVILTGGVDLSIASTTAAAAVVIGLGMNHGWGWQLACAAGIGAAIAMGLVTGIFIGYAGISFFVVTLGALSIFQSIALLMSGGDTISLFGNEKFNPVINIVNGNIGPFPSVLLILVPIYLLGGFVLRYTTFGRAVFAVGSNPEGARLSGIRVKSVLVAVYAISGLSAGIAAIIQTGRLTAAAPQADPNLLLGVIAAVLIGGTAFTGGDGGVIGTVIGVFFLGVVQNGIVLLGISSFWQGTVSGVVLIAAVGFGVLRQHDLRRRFRGHGRAEPPVVQEQPPAGGDANPER